VGAGGRVGLPGAGKRGASVCAGRRGGVAVGHLRVGGGGAGERLELTHRASDRRIYARGALRAAQWLHGRPPGLYGMAEVLGLAAQGGG
jgi:4-hydroxy-tetrahydrodipicolinate reductase